SLAVGVVLFIVIAVIQFVVITKGAARVSEVAARFVLDAMPGKQMAIDSDLNAGLITDDQARQRRGEIAREADFYGSMDGASKFLRGDAVASIIITSVNIIGGLYIGRMQYGWSWDQTVYLFTRLTIGEGLVMQAPAFIIAISAAMIVTRGNGKSNLGEEVIHQLTGKPVVLAITAVFLGLLALTPLPTLPLLMLGGGAGGLAWMLWRRQQVGATEPALDKKPATKVGSAENYEEFLSVDPMRIELGYSLVRLVDVAQGGDLLERVATLRGHIASEMGLLVPPIKIRDDMRLDAHSYSIQIRGQKVAGGRLYAKQLLAIRQDSSRGELIGRPAVEPVSGGDAVWIGVDQRAAAERMNYLVLSASDAIIRHLGEVVRVHAAELLTRQQVGKLLDNLRSKAGNLVGEATEKLRVGQIQKVLANLLAERVSIRDLEGILEAMIEAAGQSSDSDSLTEAVRASLGRTLSRQYCDDGGKLWCVCLEGELEEAITSQIGGGRANAVVPPELAGRLTDAVGEALGDLKRQGRQPIVLCSPQVRQTLRKLIAPGMPEAAVLAYNEIESVEIQSTATVGI
ncbi:MAG: flagellar type III secretion system protein FlhA, partial [Planctomycetaceae bacterium]